MNKINYLLLILVAISSGGVFAVFEGLTAYDILLVNKDNFNKTEMNRNKRRLVLQFDPDKNRTRPTTEKIKAVNNAFAILNDDRARNDYNQQQFFDDIKSRYTELKAEIEGGEQPANLYNILGLKPLLQLNHKSKQPIKSFTAGLKTRLGLKKNLPRAIIRLNKLYNVIKAYNILTRYKASYDALLKQQELEENWQHVRK